MKVVDNRMWQIYLVGIILRKLKSKTTMDIYAQVKYNKPEELLSVVNAAFAPSVGV